MYSMGSPSPEHFCLIYYQGVEVLEICQARNTRIHEYDLDWHSNVGIFDWWAIQLNGSKVASVLVLELNCTGPTFRQHNDHLNLNDKNFSWPVLTFPFIGWTYWPSKWTHVNCSPSAPQYSSGCQIIEFTAK